LNKVLIAVDDRTTQKLLAQIISQILQQKHDIAEDRFRAFEKINNSKYRLIILSIRMHDDCWIDVIETVKALSPATEMIVITNSECDDFKSSILQHGVAHILNKPFSITELQDAVLKVTKYT